MATSNHASVPAAMPANLAGWTLQRRPEAPPENLEGRLFARRYLLEKRIAGGGMSTIYVARDGTLVKQVVVKIMRADLPIDPVDRFRREAVVLARLTHEHIGGIIDRQDPDDGPRFLVAEYIDGLDLGLLRRRGVLNGWGRERHRGELRVLMFHGLTDKEHSGLENCQHKHPDVERFEGLVAGLAAS